MNLANKLTTFRVLCIPIFVVFMLIESIPYNYYLAAIVFIIASITDLFDGKIARKYHLVTNFGKFMDPLADKMLVSAALICLTPKMIPSWVVIIIISRELFISGFRMLAADQGICFGSWLVGQIQNCFLNGYDYCTYC